MFLHSLAERHRRAALISLGLGALTAQALVGLAPLERAAAWCLRPVSAAVMPAASWLVERVAPLPAAPPPPPVAADALVEAERARGRPEPVPGVVWIEVPVARVDPARGVWLLTAGRAFGLAPGMPVVFGRAWVGRVETTGPESATVRLWTAAAQPTPARLRGEDDRPLRAVAEGRGRGERPSLRWVEARSEPLAEQQVRWRPRVEDPPVYASFELLLGTLERVGESARGSDAWEVEPALPSGAEGRVFVAAGAVADSVVAEPPVATRDAWPALRSDGVFGPDLCAVRSAEVGPAAVVLTGERVLGRVVERRGSLLWCARRAPADWSDQDALGLDAAGAFGGAALRFTRGGAGVPRGLFLGTAEDPAPEPRPPLRASVRIPVEEPDA